MDDFSDAFRFTLIKNSALALGEGLHNRLRSLAYTHRSLSGLLTAAKTKRYTLTRLQRTVMRILLDISAPEHDPPYIRILGFRKQSEQIVSEITRYARVPVFIHGADVKNPPPMLAKEWEAGGIYRLAQKNPDAKGERSKPLVLVKP
jgi:hypothetical protein